MDRQTPAIALRPAKPEDASRIIEMIEGIAKYEKLEDQLEIDEAKLSAALFGPSPVPRAIVAEFDGFVVGYAMYFFNFSTFVGKKGVYLEDLYVEREYRGNGIGKALFMGVVNVARDEDCGRMEWMALDWNEPALEFYRSRGAAKLDEWRLLRLTRSEIASLAD